MRSALSALRIFVVSKFYHDLAAHDVFYCFGELLEREGLGQEMKVLLAFEILLESILGIARDEDDLGSDAAPAQFLEQRRPVHFGHHHIGKNEIELAVPLPRDLERALAGIGLEDGVAAGSKRAGG